LSFPNYREFAYYAYGLKTGALSFLRNGFGAGFRATASSLLQPVNSYTRFPEYFFLEEAFKTMARGGQGGRGSGGRSVVKSEGGVPGRRLEVLDVGSPKLAGLYLASRYDLRLRATDISPLNLGPYERMWSAVRNKARGAIEFETQDGRRLTYAAGRFDLAYALSVLEHIEGEGGDTAAVGEMLRVVKPGGRLVLSVPLGPTYIEQRIAGMAHAVERTRAPELFFFQRIYDKRRLESNILDPVRQGGGAVKIVTVFRRDSMAASAAHLIRGLPESIVTALGFLNPLLSRTLNRHAEGLVDDFRSSYGPVHSFGDIYGDAVIAIDKLPAGGKAGSLERGRMAGRGAGR
jgi:SAM-dependent methyltransferase